jgi:hypothetical protein
MSTDPVFYIIVYPRGDKSKIAVACAQSFDVPDYSLASRQRFDEATEACTYARQLAKTHGKTYEPYNDDGVEDSEYLD